MTQYQSDLKLSTTLHQICLDTYINNGDMQMAYERYYLIDPLGTGADFETFMESMKYAAAQEEQEESRKQAYEQLTA